MRLSDLLSTYGIFPAIVAGCILAGILAATMSTADSQLLAAASALSENLVQDVFGVKLTEKQTMLIARLTVVARCSGSGATARALWRALWPAAP